MRKAPARRGFGTCLLGGLSILAAVAPLQAQDEAPRRTDFLTFAHGAIPLTIGGAGPDHGAGYEHSVALIDGNPGGFSMLNRATDETDVEFVYQLPAPTTFDRFAIPNVLETPSPSQTFFRTVEIYGSSEGPSGDFTLLASGTLSTHESRGQVTELSLENTAPVQWVRVRLVGGIEMLREQMFLEFSEVIGNGTQETPPLSEAFTGAWDDRGVDLELLQDAAAVRGCYDRGAPLDGSVTGNILRARGVNPSDGVVSLFILAVADDGSVQGVRSDNGAPFRLWRGAAAAEGYALNCPDLAPPTVGCGSVVHGIRFDFDSARIRTESEPVLAALFGGLSEDPASSIVIEGHTSSEGSEEYNQSLSERRAQSVVDDLIRRGVATDRLSAEGIGEVRPIASNEDESGRSLNRRVEIRCGG